MDITGLLLYLVLRKHPPTSRILGPITTDMHQFGSQRSDEDRGACESPELPDPTILIVFKDTNIRNSLRMFQGMMI